jgi:hypothetical protein
MTATDQEKLQVLLPHWIEHNAEHAAEFRAWAEKARQAGHEEMADEIDTAARKLERANEALRAAIDKLGGLP